MNDRRIGSRTMHFPTMPEITGAAGIVGVKEGKGPQAQWFDKILQDDYYGEKTWEKAESKMLKNSISMAAENAKMKVQNIDVLLSGDLLNQLMSSSYMARDVGIPYLGLYGACSTMTESLLLAGVLVDGGYCRSAAAAASSHFATAERQFRMPLEHGNQRPPQAQWTATAAGAAIVRKNYRKSLETDGIPENSIPENSISDSDEAHQPEKSVFANTTSSSEKHICITHGTVGRVIDPGITDTNFMGGAMAPAAYDTIRVHLTDLGRKACDYDLILTGDLGIAGRHIMQDLTKSKPEFEGFKEVYEDCGAIMYSKDQDAHSGGSGCGCSASIICGRIIKELRQGKYKRVMLISTGALVSTISTQQGETVPGVAHAVTLEVC